VELLKMVVLAPPPLLRGRGWGWAIATGRACSEIGSCKLQAAKTLLSMALLGFPPPVSNPEEEEEGFNRDEDCWRRPRKTLAEFTTAGRKKEVGLCCLFARPDKPTGFNICLEVQCEHSSPRIHWILARAPRWP
jgi:hypothetical protein